MESAEKAEETAATVRISLLQLTFLRLLQFYRLEAVSFAIIHHCPVIELGFHLQ